MKLERTKGSLNYLSYLLHRYWRLSPPLMATIAFMLLLPLLGSGPLWHDFVVPEVDRCRRNWWVNVLFISNWRPLEEICLPSTWYLCCDMQLHLVALFIIIMLYRKPVVGMVLNCTTCVVSIAAITTVTLWKGFLPSLVHITADVQLLKEMVTYIHWQPYTHMAPYAVGIAVGYILLRMEKVTFRPVTRAVGWTAAATCNMAVLYGAYGWNNGQRPTTAVTIVYASCHRLMWSLGLAWTTYMCLTGQGGIINTILTWKAFVPLSRLTYASYLIHSLVMYLRIGSLREKLNFGHYDQVYLFLGHLAVTVAAASIVHLVFEQPFISLERIYISRREEQSDDLKQRSQTFKAEETQHDQI